MDNKDLLRIMKVAYKNGENKTLKELYKYAETINATEIIKWYEDKDFIQWKDNNIAFVLNFNGFRHCIKDNLKEVKDYISDWYTSDMRESFEQGQFNEGFTIFYSEMNDFEVDFEVTEATTDNKTVYLKCVEGAC